MSETKMVQIGNVKITHELAENIYNNREYLVTYTGVFQLDDVCYRNREYSYYGRKIIETRGLVKRGTFKAMTGNEVNNLIGKKIVINFEFDGKKGWIITN